MSEAIWDQRMIDLAEHVAQWSKDPVTKVGAVITDHCNRVVSVGYNGFPRWVKDDAERYVDQETKYGFVVHAELNAILNANQNLSGNTIYTTLFPCRECAKAIIQSGIVRVFYKNYRKDAYTEQMFDEAQLFVKYMP